MCVQKPYYIGLLTRSLKSSHYVLRGMWGRLQSAPLHNKIPGHYHLARNLDAEEHTDVLLADPTGLLHKIGLGNIAAMSRHSSVP